MENKFIEMAASDGQAVAYTIGPNVVNIVHLNFCEQKFLQHGQITIANDCNGLSLLIFEEIWPNYASGL